MGRIFTIGEALIDFIPVDQIGSLKEVNAFSKMAGGAPANVAVSASKLGSKAYFIGMVGSDSFGEFLVDTLNKYGVDTRYTVFNKKVKTALAFVSLGADGSRDFSFYREPSADLFLHIDDVKDIEFEKDDIISFGSVDLVPFPVKDATIFLLEKAKKIGVTILFDPNIRQDLWDDKVLYKKTVLEFIKYADILKVSDDEIEFITGEKEIDKAMFFLKKQGAKNIILTLGKNGANAYFEDIFVHCDGFSVKAIDTTGAGDSFVGATLNKLDEIGKKVDELTEDEIKNILKFANKVGSITATKKGAMDSLPSKDDIA